MSPLAAPARSGYSPAPTGETLPVVHCEYEGKKFEVPAGANLREALLRNGVSPYRDLHKLTNCRGNGMCGTCRVVVFPLAALSPRTAVEDRKLIDRRPKSPLRLSCQATVLEDCVVRTFP